MADRTESDQSVTADGTTVPGEQLSAQLGAAGVKQALQGSGGWPPDKPPDRISAETMRAYAVFDGRPGAVGTTVWGRLTIAYATPDSVASEILQFATVPPGVTSPQRPVEGMDGLSPASLGAFVQYIERQLESAASPRDRERVLFDAVGREFGEKLFAFLQQFSQQWKDPTQQP